MAKVFGGNRNTRDLNPADFDGSVLVATIDESQAVNTAYGARRIVKLREYPDTPYWCGAQQTAGIVRVLGNDDDEWKGKKLALEVRDVENPQTGGTVRKFYPMNPIEWKAAVAEYEAEERGEAAAPEKKPRKRSAKKS